MLPRPVVIGLAVLISIMWAANLIVGFLYPGRSDPALNAIFAIVVGAVFALGRREQPGDRQAGRAARKRLARMIDPEPESGDEQSDRGDRV